MFNYSALDCTFKTRLGLRCKLGFSVMLQLCTIYLINSQALRCLVRLRNIITKSVKKRLNYGNKSRSVNKNCRSLWNMKVYYRNYNSPLLFSFRRQMNSVHPSYHLSLILFPIVLSRLRLIFSSWDRRSNSVCRQWLSSFIVSAW